LKHFNDEKPEDGGEYERFLEDLEEDPVLRANVNLHKLPAETNAKMKILEDRITEISPGFEVK
jgi:serine kinase of HPr protein (carbohydrate metabolism regulator)